MQCRNSEFNRSNPSIWQNSIFLRICANVSIDQNSAPYSLALQTLTTDARRRPCFYSPLAELIHNHPPAIVVCRIECALSSLAHRTLRLNMFSVWWHSWTLANPVILCPHDSRDSFNELCGCSTGERVWLLAVVCLWTTISFTPPLHFLYVVFIYFIFSALYLTKITVFLLFRLHKSPYLVWIYADERYSGNPFIVLASSLRRLGYPVLV